MYEELKVSALYDLSRTIAAPLLERCTYPWEALAAIRAFIEETGPQLSADEYDCPRPGVWVHKTAVVAPTAFLGDNIIIGPKAEVRGCGRQLDRTEKRHPVRQRTGAALQLCRRFSARLQVAHGRRLHYLQCQKR